MHYLHSGMEPTLVASAASSTKMLPESRHLDIPWKEFYCRTITKTTCTGTSLGLESSLSARDSYILSLHARTRHTMNPRHHNNNNNRSRNSSPIHKSFSLAPSTTIRLPTHSTLNSRGAIGKRFKRQSHVIRLQKAVLMKNSFEAAARDYDAMGNGFAAEKQRKRAKLPQKYIDKIAEQDDPITWTFPPGRFSAAAAAAAGGGLGGCMARGLATRGRRDCLPLQKSTLASVSYCGSGFRI